MGSQSPRGNTRNTSNLSTMFVQADSSCNFREIVQRLTGPSTSSPNPIRFSASKPEPSSPKLHERRKYFKPSIDITRPISPCGFQFQPLFLQQGYPYNPIPMTCSSPSPRGGPYGPISPSCPASPSTPNVTLTLRPPCNMQSTLTAPHHGLASPSSNKRGSSIRAELNPVEEEKAIKERRFNLQASPRSKPKQRPGTQPQLLTLFPLTSSPINGDEKTRKVVVTDDDSSNHGLHL